MNEIIVVKGRRTYMYCEPWTQNCLLTESVIGTPLISVLHYTNLLCDGWNYLGFLKLGNLGCENWSLAMTSFLLDRTPLDPFMTNMYSQLEYSEGEFHTLQPITLAPFDAVD